MYHCPFVPLQSTLKPITHSSHFFCAPFTLYKDRQGTHKCCTIAMERKSSNCYKVKFGELRMAISSLLASDRFSEGHLIHH